jgi:hypothetical protein
MIETLTSVAFVTSRYLHVVATAMIVGGTLFYLWVVPFAIHELKEESQKTVFARARLVFRWIVFISALLLLFSGAFITARRMWIYRGEQIPMFRAMARVSNPTAPPTQTLDHPTIFDRPTLWFSLHLAGAALCLIIAIALVRGGRPPQAPVFWMRLNFILLLVTILLAVMSRNAGQRLFESIRPAASPLPSEVRE